VSDDFRTAIEQVKLRSPIEDVVRERVPALRRTGALWVACCPFHEEKTPSFKVDPRRGTWHCYGACSTGGDQISFVERSYNVEFMEALDILASRAGVSLPERRSQKPDEGRFRALYAALKKAEDLYRRQLRGPSGKAALEYLRARGLDDTTIDAFGVGYAVRGGDQLVSRAPRANVSVDVLESAGLARRNDSGRAWDFFQDRIMFPVRDLKGRTVGFGGRRMRDDDPRVPKYVNTSETPLFRKGQLIYGLDRTLEHARRAGELVLVEGYTDVMAAHQVGINTVAAVLGTSTTDEHAGLVRRAGARKVRLVFDGDEAGRRATLRALHGLLPLDAEIGIVRLPGDEDPADLMLRDGAEPFRELLDNATPWFDFLVDQVAGEPDGERWRAVDTVLELIGRLRRPLQRDEYLEALARALETPVDGVRAQYDSLPERRRQLARERREREEQRGQESEQEEIVPLAMRAYEELVGAMLLDPELAEALGPIAERCPDEELRSLLEAIVRVHRRDGDRADVDAVLVELGENPARNRVVPLLEEASTAEEPRVLFDGAVLFLNASEEERRIREQAAGLAYGGDPETSRLEELHKSLRARVL
jgi:DNA primase